LCHAVDICNHLVHPSTGKIPILDHGSSEFARFLRPFGCHATVYLGKINVAHGKLFPRGVSGIYVGSAVRDGTKGYIIWIPSREHPWYIRSDRRASERKEHSLPTVTKEKCKAFIAWKCYKRNGNRKNGNLRKQIQAFKTSTFLSKAIRARISDLERELEEISHYAAKFPAHLEKEGLTHSCKRGPVPHAGPEDGDEDHDRSHGARPA
jgi:hypothetical protein